MDQQTLRQQASHIIIIYSLSNFNPTSYRHTQHNGNTYYMMYSLNLDTIRFFYRKSKLFTGNYFSNETIYFKNQLISNFNWNINILQNLTVVEILNSIVSKVENKIETPLTSVDKNFHSLIQCSHIQLVYRKCRYYIVFRN